MTQQPCHLTFLASRRILPHMPNKHRVSGWRGLYMSAVNFLLTLIFSLAGKNAAKYSANLRFKLTGWIADKTIDFEPIRERRVAPRCLLCGGVLKERHGYSKFIGCANYPTCKYTEKL
jgi:hypothetical protein